MAVAEMPHVPGEILVKFKPEGSALSQNYHRSIGARQLGGIPELGVQRVKLMAGMSLEKGLGYYKSLSTVQYAEPNGIWKADSSVNDPLYSKQYSGPKMKLPSAWDLTFSNDKVVVAILDTGVDYNHPDLAGKVIKGHDWINDDDDPFDDNSHGTHCAGIAAAKTNNGVGIAGMGYNSSILAIKVLSGGGSGSWEAVASGILEAANSKADIISLSLGGAFASQVAEDAIKVAWSKGVLIFAASGNDGSASPHYPGAFVNCIAVGASDQNDLRAGFSNYGADWVDVAAPGVGILSTIPNNQYAEFDGTSMACPNAAGVASLVIAYSEKTMTNQEVRAIIENSCDKIGNWISKGRVNAFVAVQNAVRPIIETRPASSVKLFAGKSFTGSVASLAKVDKVYYTAFSTMVSQLGGIAGPEVTFDYPYTASRFLGGTVNLRGNAVLNTTVSVYLKRNTGVYDLLGSAALTSTDKSIAIALPTSIAPYLSSGKLTLVARSVLPSRFGSSTYPFDLDFAAITTRTSTKTGP
ncbi:MAG: S8 family peptidase [Fimbriimonas sp.]